MNDFTKNDLVQIYTAVMHLMDNHCDYRDSNHQLQKKLQSRIDNYCEHEYSTGCMECGAFECNKCQRYFSYEEIK